MLSYQDVLFCLIFAGVATILVEAYRRKKTLNAELDARDNGQKWEYTIYYKGRIKTVRYSNIRFKPEEIVLWVLRHYGIEEWQEYDVVVRER